MPIVHTKSKTEILGRMMLALEKNAGITATYPGSIARAFAEAVSVEIGDLYEALKFSVDQTSLATATGRSLDLIGELYGVNRKPITVEAEQERSSYNIEFYISAPEPGPILIPKGTLVYNDVTEFASRQYQYVLQSDVIIFDGTTRAYGSVVPNFASADFTASKNTLTKHNFSNLGGAIVYCTNNREVYSLSGLESDDSYRRRISFSIKESSYGTAESMRLVALATPGVRDVRIRESSYGLGSCDVIVVPESQRFNSIFTESILNNLASRKPVGIRLNVRVANRVPVNVVASIVLPSGLSNAGVTAIENQASIFVRRYLNASTIGTSISFSDIEQQILASSDLIRSVNITSLSANGLEVPKGAYSLPTDREYMVSGSVSIFSVIMSSNGF